jgi:peptide/nickel transport system permease protein
LAITTLFLVVSLAGPGLVAEPPLQTNFRAILKPPSWAHWFGTDELGRDILSRVVHQDFLELVLSAVIGALLMGGGLGIWAGFRAVM